MKKSLRAVFVILSAVFFLLSAWAALPLRTAAADRGTVTLARNVSDYRYRAELAGRTDVLDGKCPFYQAPKYPQGLSDDPILRKLTDGVYAIDPTYTAISGDEASKAYFNMMWCAKDAQKALEEAGGTYTYPLADGKTGAYLYTLEWKDLQADVRSFSLWFNNETAYKNTSDSSYSWWQQDAEFQILVSQDGGRTYTVAFASAPLTKTSGGSLQSCASKLKSEGGNWEMFDALDETGSPIFRYRVCAADFEKEYKGVTNVVYAAVHTRRNGNSADPFYYAARISEFDVYDTALPAAPETAAVTTAKTAPATTESSPAAEDPSAPALSVKIENAQREKFGVSVLVRVTNDSDYDVYDAVVHPYGMFGKDFLGTQESVWPLGKIPAHESREFSMLPDEKNEKTVSPFLWIGIGGGVLLLGAGIFFLIKKNRKGAGSLLLLLLCVAMLLTPQPASAETDGNTGSTVPAVRISKILPENGNERFQYLSFVAAYSVPEKQTLSFREDCSVDGETYPVSLTLEYSEYGVLSGGIRAVPTYGLDTLPLAAAEGRLNLQGDDVRGADIADCPIPEKNSSEGTFYGVYPDKFYTDTYRTKLTAVAWIDYAYRGKTYTVYSEPAVSSVLLAAEEKLKDESVSEAEKAQLKAQIIEKAGKPAVLSDGEEAALRQGILDKIEEMGSIRWTPAATVSTDGQLNYSTPKYEAGKTYYGLIYNQYHYGTADAFAYLLDKDGKLDPACTKDINALWNLTPGVSCSTSLTGAIAYFCPGMKQIVGAANMIPSKTTYGFSKIGNYTVPAGAELTEEIIAAAGPEAVYAAYAALKPADILVSVWKNGKGEILAHSIMARELPEVVYKADGSVDPARSKIKTVEQHATVIEENGKLTTWKHAESTFESLLNGKQMKFIPVQYSGLAAESALPSYCILSGLRADALLTEGLSGLVESNYPIRYFGVRVTDAAGKTVYDRKITPDTGYAKVLALGTETEFNNALKALPAGTYTVRLTAMAKNTERVLFEGSVTK